MQRFSLVNVASPSPSGPNATLLMTNRVVESVLERLVDWAAAALEKSSNQPVLPHAIIAFNASENDIPEELWDVEQATAALMESLSRTVYQNATFKKYAQFWRVCDRQLNLIRCLRYYADLGFDLGTQSTNRKCARTGIILLQLPSCCTHPNDRQTNAHPSAS